MTARHQPTPRAHSGAVVATVLSWLLLAGCSGATLEDAGVSAPADAASEEHGTVAPAELRANVSGRKQVTVDKLVTVAVEGGRLHRVRLTARNEAPAVPGETDDDQVEWTATERLEPGTAYRLVAVAENEAGERTRLKRSFRTVDLSLDQQTYPSIAPLDGETVGVGMPVLVQFDVPVADRAEIERHLAVESKPAQRGSWHWISDHEVRWRPKEYWKPGSTVTVRADLNGVDAGNGVFGQLDRESSFSVGDAVVMKVDVPSHAMRVFENGKLLRTLPVSAGKDGFATRSGTKVIVEKHRFKDMDAATTGISEDDPEYYNMIDVEYALRVTYSGEFLHAAPWSVGSQGNANVSHGCVGMSTSDAAWLYDLARRGDVVEVTGTDRQMEPANGFGDWNLSWKDYRSGSAL